MRLLNQNWYKKSKYWADLPTFSYVLFRCLAKWILFLIFISQISLNAEIIIINCNKKYQIGILVSNLIKFIKTIQRLKKLSFSTFYTK